MNRLLLLCMLTGLSAFLAARTAREPDALPAPPEGVTGENLLKHIKILASDEFEGRGPGAPAEKLTVDYLVGQFKRLGLQPGNPDGTFVQAVPLVGIRSESTVSFTVAGKKLDLLPRRDFLARSYRVQSEITVANSGVVFAGYGIVAPEFGWDDYKDSDVRGKTVILLEGEPALADPKERSKPDESRFQGRTETYYGTSAHKFEIAGQKGAAAVLLLHDPDTAWASFTAYQKSYQQESLDLKAAAPPRHPVAVEGRLTLEAFAQLCAATHQDSGQLRASAQTETFKPVTCGATADFTVQNQTRDFESQNVVARVAGSDAKLRNEFVIYTAHWDHLGRDSTLSGDQIYNGAIDNAAGVAQLLEIAAAFARSPTRPRRSLLFIATTAEEKGYLGARHYTTHPLYPLARTLANINLDASNLWGRTSDVNNLGYGLTTLDAVLTETAAMQQRKFVAQPYAGGTYFFLSDQFEFAKAGIPAVFPGSGSTYRGQPADYGDKRWAEYGAKHYHQVSDEVQADWDLTGTVEDVQWLWLIGYRIAQADKFPEWKPGAGFSRKR